MRLDRQTIYKIVAEYERTGQRSVVAERFSIDPSTVDYQVTKFAREYGDTSYVFSLITPKKEKTCECTRLKCPECGRSQDNMRTRQSEQIRQLRRALEIANQKLEQLGSTAVGLELL